MKSPNKSKRLARPARARGKLARTVRASELSGLSMVAGNEKKFTKVVDDGLVKQWVGFGWVTEGPAESPRDDQLLRVVRD